MPVVTMVDGYPGYLTEPPVVGGSAGANPSAVYCESNKGKYELGGVCVFPDGSSCDSWRYYSGECKIGEGAAPIQVMMADGTPIYSIAGQASYVPSSIVTPSAYASLGAANASDAVVKVAAVMPGMSSIYLKVFIALIVIVIIYKVLKKK
jgi:hypothetical protein